MLKSFTLSVIFCTLVTGFHSPWTHAQDSKNEEKMEKVKDPMKFTVDPEHSSAHFEIQHFMSMVSGTAKISGSLMFHPENTSVSKADIVGETTSIQTGNLKRDDHIKSEDFFNAKKYPQMMFKSVKIEKGQASNYRLKGDLTIKGITKPIEFDAKFLGMMKDQDGKEHIGFEATGEILRSQFDITWNKTLDNGKFILGDKVTLKINVEGIQAPAAHHDAKM